MRLTNKQLQILDILCDGNEDNSPMDIGQLLEGLESKHSWRTTKQSMQFSIRALIKHGLMTKAEDRELRDSRLRVLLAASDLGRIVMGRNE